MKLNKKFWENTATNKKNLLENLFEDEKQQLSNNISALLLELMQQEHITPAELSRRLDSSRASVSNTLKPGRNMTLQTLVKYLRVLGYRVRLEVERIDPLP